MMKALVATVAAALLLLVVGGLASAKPFAAPAATASQFSGGLQGHETNAPGVPGQTFIATGDVSGIATGLGQYTLHYQIEVNATTRASSNGTATFRTANGDTLKAVGRGQGGPSGMAGVGAPTEWYTITGGTGRFAGASGGYTVHRLVNATTGATWGTFDGSIMLAQGK